MNNFKKVETTLITTAYSAKKYIQHTLPKLEYVSFDTETRSVYDKEFRKEASDYLKQDDIELDDNYRLAKLSSNSSGLSHPSITRTTHFIFGESSTKSTVIICNSFNFEMLLWKLISKLKLTVFVHNSLFDLKIMFNRTGLIFPNFVDTSLLAKCLTNHVNIWKCKVGLKELMGSYYDPTWSLMNDYEPDNLKDKNFINYCGIDGAATFHLAELLNLTNK